MDDAAINEDLWTVLLGRSEGTANTKVKSANTSKEQGHPNKGLQAYRLLNTWYTGIGGLDISNRRGKLTNPQLVEDAKIIEVEQHEQ